MSKNTRELIGAVGVAAAMCWLVAMAATGVWFWFVTITGGQQ